MRPLFTIATLPCGESIEVEAAPTEAMLGCEHKLTNEFRVPEKGEFYWQWFDDEWDRTLVGPGKVRQCAGGSRHAHHIVKPTGRKYAVWSEAKRGWIAVTRSTVAHDLVTNGW